MTTNASHASAAQAERARGPRLTYVSDGVHMWCDYCDEAHTHAGATVGDTPESVLGLRGVASTITYAWCERERLYHYTSRRRAMPNPVHPGRWTLRVAQPKRSVATRTIPRNVKGGRAATLARISAQYDAQRVTRSRAPMLRGGGSVAFHALAPVALTDGARRTLARVNRWGTDEGRAERERDGAALYAKILAREVA